MFWGKKEKQEDVQPIAASILASSIKMLSGALERFALLYEREKIAQAVQIESLIKRIAELEVKFSTYPPHPTQMMPHEQAQGPDDSLRDLLSRPDQHPL